MEELIKKKEDETSYEYGLRLIKLKKDGVVDIDWEEIVKLTGLELNKDSLRKANDTIYGGYNVAKYYEDKIANMKNNSNDNSEIKELIQEYEDKKQEFEKEKIKFQDQKREYRALLRTDARFEHLKSEMLIALDKIRESKPFLDNYVETYNSEEVHAVAIFSDWHYGIECENYWNKINTDICKQRVMKLRDEIIKYCKLNKVDTLHIELQGDLVNGYLHLGCRVSNEEDVMSQAMNVSELIAEVIDELSKYIPHIKVYSTYGNHGRCTANKKESIDVENFERMIPWALKKDFKDKSNVEFIDNKYDEGIIVYQFLNETIFGAHGDKDKFKGGINSLLKMLKIFPTEFHRGHNHSFAEEDSYDMTVTTNGTLSGVDEYAKDLRLTGTATQTLMMYNKDGRYCTYKIKLN